MTVVCDWMRYAIYGVTQERDRDMTHGDSTHFSDDYYDQVIIGNDSGLWLNEICNITVYSLNLIEFSEKIIIVNQL